ncbi:MAG: phospholipase D-like domain-containing protein [Thermofilum sp.]|jgi:phosphatidylserine/phosphatidylglycerophosphate/cardiolipin synthase-like enzyme|nr:phospholipase D-like domain-containing protein [Thermofilum sp.]
MSRRSSTGIILAVIIIASLAFYAGFRLGQTQVQQVPPATQQAKCIKLEVINDGDYYPKLLDLISKANKSIYVSMYEFKSDTSEVSRVLELLISKAKKGVDVKVVLENTIDVNELTYRRLLDGGVPVRFDTRSRTTHTKLIIIDGYIVIVGSHNWSYSAFTRNHEASILVYDEDVARQETEYFMQIYSGN